MQNSLGKSFGYAINGFLSVWREERNFRLECLMGIIVILLALNLKFSYLESAIIVLCVTVVLSAEMVNTAIEDLCNKVEPNQDQVIGKIKDIMAGFTLISSFGSAVVGLIIFGQRLF